MLTIFLAIAATVQEPGVRRLLPADSSAPGCALDVRRDGKTVEAITAGSANLEYAAPIVSETIFEIGSVSKQFIGAGLAVLATRGKLSLDDPISKWLPELPPLYRHVTVRMLAYHTSGIRSWNNLAELTVLGEDSTGYDNKWVLRAIARQRRLNSDPGAEYLYSNSNFVLAAVIIERASGQKLNSFYRDTLFERLGMTHTHWRTDFREIVPGRAQAYLPDDHGGWRLDMPFNDVAGAGGLLSTVGDLQRWNAALAEPAVADRGWVEALQQSGRLSDGTVLMYGMGIETSPIEGIAAFSHAGATASYRAWLGRFPTERLSIALLCNSGAVNTEDLGPEVAKRFLPTATTDAASRLASGDVPDGLTGLYRNTANDSLVEATVDARGLHFNNGPGFFTDSKGSLVTVDGRRSVMVGRDRAGRVTGISVSRIGNSATRLIPVTAWKPLPAELRRLAGTYASADIDGIQRIESVGPDLFWRDPSGVKHQLMPTYRNAFVAPDVSWTLRFLDTRGVAGSAVDFSITRARKIRYSRIAVPKAAMAVLPEPPR